ncbi:hypothetical protein KVT40_009219 [Elsinoe batatas]|uniref:Uncharacterized protein n=1 Tax=Elsinoe batatas TaxID=2601811 RepID=A0A8K0KSW6_9PEZI|nr:hypothetical protein KVT40_009219 [Elsinoe batatas]
MTTTEIVETGSAAMANSQAQTQYSKGTFTLEEFRGDPMSVLRTLAIYPPRRRRNEIHNLLSSATTQYYDHLDLQEAIVCLADYAYDDLECRSLLRQNQYTCLDASLNFGTKCGVGATAASPSRQHKNDLLGKIRQIPSWENFPDVLPSSMTTTYTGHQKVGIGMLYQWLSIERLTSLPNAASILRRQAGSAKITKAHLQNLAGELKYKLLCLYPTQQGSSHPSLHQVRPTSNLRLVTLGRLSSATVPDQNGHTIASQARTSSRPSTIRTIAQLTEDLNTASLSAPHIRVQTSNDIYNDSSRLFATASDSEESLLPALNSHL